MVCSLCSWEHLINTNNYCLKSIICNRKRNFNETHIFCIITEVTASIKIWTMIQKKKILITICWQNSNKIFLIRHYVMIDLNIYRSSGSIFGLNWKKICHSKQNCYFKNAERIFKTCVLHNLIKTKSTKDSQKVSKTLYYRSICAHLPYHLQNTHTCSIAPAYWWKQRWKSSFGNFKSSAVTMVFMSFIG